MHKEQVSTKLIEMLHERFRSLDEKIWEAIKWFDSKFWTIEKDFGEDQIAPILMFLRSELNGNRSNAMSNIILYESKQTNCGETQRISHPEFISKNSVCSMRIKLISRKGYQFFRTSLSDKRLKMSHAVLEMR